MAKNFIVYSEETDHPFYMSGDFCLEYSSWHELCAENFYGATVNPNTDRYVTGCFDFEIATLVRYDYKILDVDGKDLMCLSLYVLNARKGNIIEMVVEKINEEDIENINLFLNDGYEYLTNKLWNVKE